MQLGRAVDAQKWIRVRNSHRFDEEQETDPDQQQIEKSNIDLNHRERKRIGPGSVKVRTVSASK